MTREWQEVRLGDLGRVVTGRTPPGTAAEYFGDCTPFVTPTDMDGRRKMEVSQRSLSQEGAKVLERVVVPHGIAVSCIGWQMGKSMLIDRPSATNQQINTLIPNERVADELFLYYALSAKRAEIFNLGSGGSRTPILSKSGFEKLTIRLPSLSEQKAIAQILGTLDDKIELNRRMNETLEAMARAIFKSWFVDFDPVRAKAAGRQPAGTDAATAALFPDRFEDSPLGSIPKGWKVGALTDIAEVVMGTSPPGDTYNEDGTGTPLVNGPVEFGDRFPVRKKWTTAPTRLAEDGDLIFCVRGSTTGRRVLADGVYCLGRGVCAIRSANGCQPFVSQTVDVGLERLLSKITGSVFPNLNGPDIKQFKILLPPEAVVRRYCGIAEPLTQAVRQNCKQSARLAAMRDALLPKLLSGEIKARDD